VETAQAFFGRELAAIDRTIKQMQDTIDADPTANGRFAGMRAMLRVQQRHRTILERLAAQSRDFADALEICRLLLVVAQREHARVTRLGGMSHPQYRDAWWNTLNEVEYLACLSQQLQDVLAREKNQNGHLNGAGR
jgi:hypothetical protein